MTQELAHGAPSGVPVAGDRYVVGELLGRGGMASVYRAEDTLLGRTVAIKFFAEEADSHAHGDRKRSEVRVLASLNHPALVTVFDANLEAEPSAYLVMEFVDGPALHERLAAGPLPATEAVRMLADLSEALTVVHGAGIVHRDIKPSNVLLTAASGGRASRAKLADFGIAQLADGTRLTMPGSFMGTAAYLAPEQLANAKPAPAADIYSLGLVILETITGERAFPGTAAESASARVVSDPSIPQSVPVALREVLSSMTAREPHQRPTAARVVEMATQAARELPVEAPSAALATAAMSADAPTRVFTAPQASDATERLHPEQPAPARRLRRVGVIAIVGALVAALAVGVALPLLTPPAPASPVLPTVEDPLGAHLDQLLEAVTP